MSVSLEPTSAAAPRPPMIDCHVHLAALPERDNGCHISRKMLRSPLFRFLLWKHDLSVSDPSRTNSKYVDDLLAELEGSQRVDKAVLLGLDAVYDSSGRADLASTDFLVGNDYVLSKAREHPDRLLAGVSINPMRRDAVDEVHRCADAGAVLVKVLPNAQHFDPARAEFKPFYRALAERGLPLLSHVGYEFALIGKDQSGGDPLRLRTALDEGATVIAAHACSYGLMIHEKFLPAFQGLVERYPRFYADISALTLPNRMRMLWHLRRAPEIHERLLFGTDYPLSVYHCACWGRVGWSVLRRIVATRNRFDRQFLVCESLGLRFRSFGDLLTARARP